jgi:formamidopyrimidine-DNA glycosylase
VPELPDIVAYLDALGSRVLGRPLVELRVMSPFVLRSVDPPVDLRHGQIVVALRRLGKRMVMVFPHELFLVFHLMVAGRLRWRDPGKKPGMGPRQLLASLEFENGTLFLTEAGSRKRASMHVVAGEEALQTFDRGGIEPLAATLDAFRTALGRESHTVKRALTDPRLFSGIGNAYSDEILHAAQLSPMKLTRFLSNEESSRLYDATRMTLTAWVERLRQELGEHFQTRSPRFERG